MVPLQQAGSRSSGSMQKRGKSSQVQAGAGGMVAGRQVASCRCGLGVCAAPVQQVVGGRGPPVLHVPLVGTAGAGGQGLVVQNLQRNLPGPGR